MYRFPLIRKENGKNKEKEILINRTRDATKLSFVRDYMLCRNVYVSLCVYINMRLYLHVYMYIRTSVYACVCECART